MVTKQWEGERAAKGQCRNGIRAAAVRTSPLWFAPQSDEPSGCPVLFVSFNVLTSMLDHGTKLSFFSLCPPLDHRQFYIKCFEVLSCFLSSEVNLSRLLSPLNCRTCWSAFQVSFDPLLCWDLWPEDLRLQEQECWVFSSVCEIVLLQCQRQAHTRTHNHS